MLSCSLFTIKNKEFIFFSPLLYSSLGNRMRTSNVKEMIFFAMLFVTGFIHTPFIRGRNKTIIESFMWLSLLLTYKPQHISLLIFDASSSLRRIRYHQYLNLLSATPRKWSNTLKQFFGNLQTNCLSVFDHFVILALKGLNHWIKYLCHNALCYIIL